MSDGQKGEKKQNCDRMNPAQGRDLTYLQIGISGVFLGGFQFRKFVVLGVLDIGTAFSFGC